MGKNMTDKAIEANRRNAERSTGPRTEEGKAAVSLNRLAHGLTGRVPLVPGEDLAAFDQLRAGLVQQLNPVGVLEEALVDRVASCTWRLWRAQRIESGLLTWRRLGLEESRSRGSDLADVLKEMNSPARPETKGWQELQEQDLPSWGLVLIHECNGGAPLEKLNRYEGALERSLYRAMHELERLQRERCGEDVPPPAVADLSVHQGGNGFEL